MYIMTFFFLPSLVPITLSLYNFLLIYYYLVILLSSNILLLLYSYIIITTTFSYNNKQRLIPRKDTTLPFDHSTMFVLEIFLSQKYNF